MTPPDQNHENPPGKGDRIAKFLARAGVCSRRDAEKLIAEGRVKVDGRMLESPAFLVTGTEKIEVDGKPVGSPAETRLWRYHKPTGLVTSHRDEQGRRTIFDSLPASLPRVISVGRLDLNSEGLLLLTNDGALSRYLELPATGWARTYRVRCFGRVDQPLLDTLQKGVSIDGINYGAIEAVLEDDGNAGRHTNHWLRMTLHEGKNREIRRVLGYLGLEVSRLIRVSYGPFFLDDLPPGDIEEVHPEDLKDFLKD